MNLRHLMVIAALIFGLSACSQTPEPIATVTPTVPTAQPSNPVPDPCAVAELMKQQLSASAARFIADPSQDAFVLLENEFNAQIDLLYLLIESTDSKLVSKKQLDELIILKDEVLEKYTESTQTDNLLQRGLLLAGTVVAAQETVSTAQELLTTLSTDLKCP